jgi:hypothetical protein
MDEAGNPAFDTPVSNCHSHWSGLDYDVRETAQEHHSCHTGPGLRMQVSSAKGHRLTRLHSLLIAPGSARIRIGFSEADQMRSNWGE